MMNKRDKIVLSALRDKVDRWGNAQVSMAELSELTLMHRDTLSLSVKNLASIGAISIQRTKRNFGKHSWSIYRILSMGETLQSVQNPTSTADYDFSMSENAASETLQSVQNPTSTASQPYLLSSTTLTTEMKLKDTSYLLPSVATGGRHTDSGAKMVNRWNEVEEEFGYGALRGERPEPVPSKRKVTTRWQRPKEEWTAADVSAEFASRLYAQIKGIPGLVNTKSLAMLLAKHRRDFSITPTVELSLLDAFFADERNLVSIRKFPKGSIGIFMNFMTTHLAETADVTLEEVSTLFEEQPALYASDGRKFAKSITGRKALERYEEKLKSA